MSWISCLNPTYCTARPFLERALAIREKVLGPDHPDTRDIRRGLKLLNEAMNQLPPSLQAFAALVDAQPGPVQVLFQYGLAMLMVEGGKARLIKTEPGESGAYCTFETVAGDVFTVLKPAMDEETEAMMMDTLREMIENDE